MEKTNLRNTPSSSKTNNSDVRSKQDGKNYRFPRYKESVSPRPDTGRKPNPQRNREAFDKRPRTRSGAVYEKYRNEVIESVETGHHVRQGSKKVNLNHLLNFSLVPSEGSRDYISRRPVRSKIKLPKYNKELFLQANCQFVIRDDGNYAPYCSNADLLVDWSLIEEVRLLSHEVPSCPICLYTPSCAKITRCGHIYCWACILHYLSLTDRTWQKCPICFEAIHSSDLKSVVSIIRNFVTPGCKIKMCLMKRDKTSLFPLPASKYKSQVSAYRLEDEEAVTRYQKLLLASKADVRAIIDRERQQLNVQLAVEQGEAEVCFVEAAFKLLQDRENILEKKGLDFSDGNAEAVECSGYSDNTFAEDLKLKNLKIEEKCLQPIYYGSDISRDGAETALPDAGSKVKESESMSAENLHVHDPCMAQNDKGKESFFYFYQAEDGQHIYLHGLNVRMLAREYGSLENSPSLFEAKVLALEKISMTEEIRKRLKYLQHIPLTCEFQIAEVQLNNILSGSTIQEFSDEVSKRQKMRSKKAREERKREKFIEIEEKKKMGMYPSPTFNLNSCDQFPVCIQETPKSASLNFPRSSGASSIDSHESDEDYEMQYPTFKSNDSSPGNLDTSRPATSFAQMLRDANTSCKPWQAISRSKTVPVARADRVDEYEDDEEAIVPAYQESFSNAMQIALENAFMDDKKDSNGAEQVTSRKKKKSKNKVLFSTSMYRSK